MTQEDKELLLKDLCARLPYGVKVNNEIQGDFNIYGICENFVFVRNEVCHIDFDIEKIKPYLFPLSNMTHKQIDYIHKNGIGIDIQINNNGIVLSSVELEGYDYLNKNHFDYRGLIEKGLAIDATNLNIY